MADESQNDTKARRGEKATILDVSNLPDLEPSQKVKAARFSESGQT